MLFLLCIRHKLQSVKIILHNFLSIHSMVVSIHLTLSKFLFFLKMFASQLLERVYGSLYGSLEYRYETTFSNWVSDQPELRGIGLKEVVKGFTSS